MKVFGVIALYAQANGESKFQDAANDIKNVLDVTLDGVQKIANTLSSIDFPKIDIPEVREFKFEAPKIEIPDIENYQFEFPKIEIPDIANFKYEAPEMKFPDAENYKFEMPEIKMPDIVDYKFDDSELKEQLKNL
ncbi:unnamed protein product [Oikopleura dioica]|uniref:Uncharacterized protein n=1 Tax=Oikopleura dioica TaxID=34765 RepID=E4YDL5_OIKDI|nr:unnamed protein product [Oikopleura dioica]